MKFKINAGELRHPVTIKRLQTEVDDDGIIQEKWNDILNTRAKIVNLRLEEFMLAQGQGYKDVRTFYIRFSKAVKIARTDKLVFLGNDYNIISLDNVENLSFYLAIKGELVE